MALTVGEANAVNVLLAVVLRTESVTNDRMASAAILLAESAHRKLGAGMTVDQAMEAVLDLAMDTVGPVDP